MSSARNEFTREIDAEPEWVGSFAKNVRCHNPGLHHKIPDKNKPLIFTAVIVSCAKGLTPRAPFTVVSITYQ